MDEALKSIWDWFKEKTTSPLYPTYAFCFMFHNWKIFFTLFFQDVGQLEGMTKVKYVTTYFVTQGGWQAFFQNMWDIFLFPAAITFCVISFLPRLHLWAHKLNVKHYFERKRIYEQENLLFAKAENRDLKELADIKREQASAKEVIVKEDARVVTTKEDLWEKEYQSLRDGLKTYGFEVVIETVYQKNGLIVRGGHRNAEADTLAFADACGLIDIDENVIRLTEKGKYFSRMYLQSRSS